MTGTKENTKENTMTTPLPDLSGWHEVPADATIPAGMPFAHPSGRAGRGYYVDTEGLSHPLPPEDRFHDRAYFTPEPIPNPTPPLPTKPGTWIEATVGSKPGVLLMRDPFGDWAGIDRSGRHCHVDRDRATDRISDWRVVRWVPADESEPESEPVQRVDLEPHDAESKVLCMDRDRDGWVCNRPADHSGLHAASTSIREVRAVWGEVQ